MLPESRAVNVAVTWEESCCAYPGRSCRREVGESESRSNNELQEVSRSHSTLRNQGKGFSSKDRKAENRGNEGFLQRESVEHQGYAEARSTDRREGKERGGASGLLEAILDRNNLNRAYKRVKSNHGAAGIDGMSVEEALPWLKEHREELLQSIRDGSYEPSPVRRKEIPKPDGGVRKLGIPTVVDRVIQQGIAQKLQNIWEPQFSDSSYGYRPKRSGQQAIQKVKE